MSYRYHIYTPTFSASVTARTLIDALALLNRPLPQSIRVRRTPLPPTSTH